MRYRKFLRSPLPPPPLPQQEADATELDLPGGMQLEELLELLRSGPRAAFEAIAGVVNRATGGGDKVSSGRHADGRGTPVDTCRRWWDAAWRAGDGDAAAVAADAFILHLSRIQVRAALIGLRARRILFRCT